MSRVKGNDYKIMDDGTVIVKCSNRADVEFIIDVDDLELIKKYTWMIDNHGYIVAAVKNLKGWMARVG